MGVDRTIVTRLLSRSGRILAGISSNMGITLLVEREKGVLRGRARTEEDAKEANRVLKLKVRMDGWVDGVVRVFFFLLFFFLGSESVSLFTNVRGITRCCVCTAQPSRSLYNLFDEGYFGNVLLPSIYRVWV